MGSPGKGGKGLLSIVVSIYAQLLMIVSVELNYKLEHKKIIEWMMLVCTTGDV